MGQPTDHVSSTPVASLLTTGHLIKTGGGVLRGVTLHQTDAGQCWIHLRDQVTKTGSIIASFASSPATDGIMYTVPGDGIRCSTGIFITVADDFADTTSMSTATPGTIFYN